MKRAVSILFLLAILGGGAWATWWYSHRPQSRQEFAIYGNVDLRQVELAFNSNERITQVLVQEGDRVRKGQLLARLDTSRIEPQVAQAQAQVEAGRHEVEKLHNGTRPEEIAQARANVESARAERNRGRQQYERVKTLSERSAGKAVSQQDLENAQAVLEVDEARLFAAQKVLELAIAGPRKEDIREAEAKLRAGEAQLAFLREQLAETKLYASTEGVVRTRIMEPGEIAFPQRPVLSIAQTDPKWVRAYVSETHLGRIHPGMKMSVAVDSFPQRRFEGWIGFISPVAEFTPKTVQTEDLRTSLVYEVRVFVKDPSDELRLGMPATVYIAPAPATSSAPTSEPATAPAGRQTMTRAPFLPVMFESCDTIRTLADGGTG